MNFPEARALLLTLPQAGAAAHHAHLQQTTHRADHHSDHHIEQITHPQSDSLSPPKGPSQRQGLARRNVTMRLGEHHRPDGHQAIESPLDRPQLHGTV